MRLVDENLERCIPIVTTETELDIERQSATLTL
jgi:hypothetical protein